MSAFRPLIFSSAASLLQPGYRAGSSDASLNESGMEFDAEHCALFRGNGGSVKTSNNMHHRTGS
jgi:hypothetical protein